MLLFFTKQSLRAEGYPSMTKAFFAGVAAGLIGGILGAYLLIQFDRSQSMRAASGTAGHARDVVAAGRIRLLDASGKLRAELAMSADRGPALFFFDTAGRNRMVLGLY